MGSVLRGWGYADIDDPGIARAIKAIWVYSPVFTSYLNGLSNWRQITEVDGGLTTREAAERLTRDGANVLPEVKGQSVLKRLAAQLFHFFALLLWVAGVLAFVAGMPQLGVAIFVVIVVNGVFAFVQESRAERVTHELRGLVPRRAVVVRDERLKEIDASDLVRGDLVDLTPGTRISADLEITLAHGLGVDESLLTGESEPVEKRAGDALFAGTVVVAGEARALVAETASATKLGSIAHLVEVSGQTPTPLARELRRVVRSISAIAIALGVAFMVTAIFLGASPRNGFLLAVGVTVALVPEGLLPTVTLSLAIGARRMASRQALVRRLDSVETLGSTTFICTDKTGTLTLNEMSVVELWTPDGPVSLSSNPCDPRAKRIATLGFLCSAGREHGDPTDVALSRLPEKLGLEFPRTEVEARVPFDPVRRRMSVIASGELVVKGAPDSVLGECVNPGQGARITEQMAERGLRVLAIASRPVEFNGEDPRDFEKDLTLIGIIGMEDPPRPEVAGSIAECRKSGVAVAMVTGDHPKTAWAIAVESGLALDDSAVIEDLPDDDVELGELVDRDGAVLARITPEEKLRIARVLKSRGHVVAMTGDGINDGPALREADIGVAMGRSGTDVAREAADVVLLDDNFGTIVAAIEQGRATFSNIRRFLTYHLTDNVAELTPFVIWALSAGRIPLAIGVLQILCLDIGTDLLPALALGAEPPRELGARRPLTGKHLLEWGVLRRVFLLLGPVEATVVMTAFAVSLISAGWSFGFGMEGSSALGAASGAAFAAVVLGQSGNAFACRSTILPPWKLGWFSNPLVLWGVAASIGALGVFLWFPPLARALGQAPPPPGGMAVATLAAPAVLAADAGYKWIRRRNIRSNVS